MEARRRGKRGAKTVGDHKKVRINRRARGGKLVTRERSDDGVPVQRDSHLCGAGCHPAVQARAAHAQSSAIAERAVRDGGCVVERDARKLRAIFAAECYAKSLQQAH